MEAPAKEEKKEEAPQSPELSIAKYYEKVFFTMLGERPNLMEFTFQTAVLLLPYLPLRCCAYARARVGRWRARVGRWSKGELGD